MFEQMTKEEATQDILSRVREYYLRYMKKPAYKDGDRIAYAGRVFDAEEMVNLVDSSLEFWLTSGRYTERLEKKFAEYVNADYCSLVNSGSSANLLAFMALTSPLLKDRQLLPGDEVITVACAFPTTVTPIIQYGAVPVFVDVTIPQYNIDVTQLEAALSQKTKAIMIAHTLGNPFNIKVVKAFCKKNNLWLIEDNCDSLGSTYTIDGETRFTGTWGDIGTCSFYPPHHITMGEGGAVYTSNPLLHKIVRSLRDWGRDCVCPSGCDNVCGHRFDRQYGELPLGYDHKFTYSHFGYNLKVTDMQSAVGCAQIEKLSTYIQRRRHNWKYLYENLSDVQDKIILPQAEPNSTPSWFGFMMCCKDNKKRNEIVKNLENNNIQTRALFAGNIIRHPCFDQMRSAKKGYRVIGDLPITDKIMNNGFWVGVYPGLNDEMLVKVVKVIKDNL